MSEVVIEFNDGHITEGLDRIHVIQSNIQYFVAAHPAIEMANCQPEIDEVQDILASVYQRIGQLSSAL